MFRNISTTFKNTKHQIELNRIGQALLQLIKLDDAIAHAKALQIIETHQHESDVINARHFYLSTPLVLACKLGKIEIAEKLLAATSIDVNFTWCTKLNALEAALRARQFDIALLLARDTRVNINATGSSGVHPVFIALRKSSNCPFVVAKTLLSRPDIDVTKTYVINIDNPSEYHYHFQNMLHGLIRGFHQFKLNEADKQDYQDALTLLTSLITSQKIDINAFAIDSHVINKTKKETALMMAAKFHLTEVVTILLAAGADPDLENEKQLTAHNIARINSFDTKCYSAYERRVANNILNMLEQYMTQRKEMVAATAKFGSLNDLPDAPAFHNNCRH
jgi:ankyrin repeat protein